MHYLIFSLLAGYVEIGCLISACQYDFPLWSYPLAAVAYQAGNLIPHPMRYHHTIYFALSMVALPIGLCQTYIPGLLFLYTFIMSASIQGFRDIAKPRVRPSTSVKRCYRITGFALAYSYGSSWSILATALICGVAYIHIKNSIKPINVIQIRIPSVNHLSTVMLIHQMHYFCYSNLMIYLFSIIYGVVIWKVIGAFILGWITYIAAPSIWKIPSRVVFLIGHIIAAISIYMIYYNRNANTGLLWWILTGIGGGTVFVLREISRNNRMDEIVDSWENIGHLFGSCLSLYLVIIFQSTRWPFLVAAAFALFTGIYGWIMMPLMHKPSTILKY